MHIPEAYVIQKLFSFAHTPTLQKSTNQYNAGCPICKEGRSTGRKKRLYYYIKTNSFYCFNCNRGWSAFSWIKEVSNCSAKEIQDEIISSNYRVELTSSIFNDKKKNTDLNLPFDSINLLDSAQINYFNDNPYIHNALTLIRNRKIDQAINRPNALYISLKDFIHKNRLCIPFYNRKNNISFYQTRSLDGSLPKYLSKTNAEKSVYGINAVDINSDYIFIFEGPIDAMFVKNGVAVCGLSLTDTQKKELDEFPFHKKIWVPDNQHLDTAAKKKTEELLKNKSSVFIWPTNFKYKDFNELALVLDQNQISEKFILKHTKKF